MSSAAADVFITFAVPSRKTCSRLSSSFTALRSRRYSWDRPICWAITILSPSSRRIHAALACISPLSSSSAVAIMGPCCRVGDYANRNEQQWEQEVPRIRVDKHRSGKEADGQDKFGVGDRGEISRQRVGFEAAMHCPAGNEVGEPPKNPDEEIAFAKSAEHK